MSEQSDVEQAGELTDSQSGQSQPSEAYKKLQRELEKARKTNRDLSMQQLLASQEAAERVARLEETLTGFMELVGTSGFAGEEEEVQKYVTGVKQGKTEIERVNLARRRVGLLLAENDTDLSDPRLQAAKQTWENAKTSGDFANAADAFERALKPVPGGPDPDQADAVTKQRELKASGKVDMGESGGAGGRAKTLPELRKVDVSRLNAEQREAHKQALLAAMAKR